VRSRAVAVGPHGVGRGGHAPGRCATKSCDFDADVAGGGHGEHVNEVASVEADLEGSPEYSRGTSSLASPGSGFLAAMRRLSSPTPPSAQPRATGRGHRRRAAPAGRGAGCKGWSSRARSWRGPRTGTAAGAGRRPVCPAGVRREAGPGRERRSEAVRPGAPSHPPQSAISPPKRPIQFREYPIFIRILRGNSRPMNGIPPRFQLPSRPHDAGGGAEFHDPPLRPSRAGRAGAARPSARSSGRFLPTKRRLEQSSQAVGVQLGTANE